MTDEIYSIISLIVLMSILLSIYSLPASMAYKFNHPHRHFILAANLFGFTGLPWILSFTWIVSALFKKQMDHPATRFEAISQFFIIVLSALTIGCAIILLAISVFVTFFRSSLNPIEFFVVAIVAAPPISWLINAVWPDFETPGWLKK